MERIKEATLTLLTGNMREKIFCFLINDLSNHRKCTVTIALTTDSRQRDTAITISCSLFYTFKIPKYYCIFSMSFTSLKMKQ